LSAPGAVGMNFTGRIGSVDLRARSHTIGSVTKPPLKERKGSEETYTRMLARFTRARTLQRWVGSSVAGAARHA
jgi:hypothetical protein